MVRKTLSRKFHDQLLFYLPIESQLTSFDQGLIEGHDLFFSRNIKLDLERNEADISKVIELLFELKIFQRKINVLSTKKKIIQLTFVQWKFIITDRFFLFGLISADERCAMTKKGNTIIIFELKKSIIFTSVFQQMSILQRICVRLGVSAFSFYFKSLVKNFWCDISLENDIKIVPRKHIFYFTCSLRGREKFKTKAKVSNRL